MVAVEPEYPAPLVVEPAATVATIPRTPTVTPAAAATVTVPRPSPIVLWSIAVIVVSVFFPWIDSPFRISRALDMPLAFLYDLSASTDGLNLAIPLLAAAGVLLALAFVPAAAWLRRGVAFVVLAAVVAVVVQWGRFLDANGTTESLLSFVGIGLYATGVAAVLLMLAPARPSSA